MDEDEEVGHYKAELKVPCDDVAVLFTGIAVTPELQEVVTRLGGRVEQSPEACTHLLSDRVRRTEKFLSGLARCRYLLHYDWVLACQRENRFVPEAPFELVDKEAECKFGFKMKDSLRKVRQAPFLMGCSIYCTKSVIPPPKTLESIVTANGGVAARCPRSFSPSFYIISCDADKSTWPRFIQLGFTIYSAELVLTGVLRQTLNLDQHILAKPAAGKNKK